MALNSTLRLSLIDDVTARTRVITNAIAGINRAASGVLAPLRSLGGALALGGGIFGAASGVNATAGAAIRFEEAFADVRKVIDGTGEQLANFRRDILGLSKELPIAATGIAEIYAAAGQSGIATHELKGFARTVAQVSTAWDVPVQETAQALSEIKTQLGLGVADVGLFADSLNHLSNNSAANAPRLLEYTNRVAAAGEMFGFTAQQSLAFGGSMISAGAESEVAATSFRNMGRALTMGTQATKSQREAYKRLGLDSVKTAKNMQKNALGTTLDVIEKIQKLPEWEQISLASALFGNEARALMPLINNSTELRRQLGLVSDQTNYAGSAFKEYSVRAETTANQLQKVRNNLAALGIAMGDRLLPPINRALSGVLEIFDTLDQRAGVFDKMSAAFRGFVAGLGLNDGGLKSLSDMVFGVAGPDGVAAGEELGRIAFKFRQFGENARAASDAVANSKIGSFLTELGLVLGGLVMSKWFRLFAIAAGIAAIASAVQGASSLGEFVDNMSKLSAMEWLGIGAGLLFIGIKAAGAAKAIRDLASASRNLPKGATAPTTPGSPAAPGGGLGGIFKGITAGALALGVLSTLGGNGEVRQLTAEEQALMFRKSADTPRGSDYGGLLRDPGAHGERLMGAVDLGTLRQAMAPQGVQAVNVTNPQPAPQVSVVNHFTISGAGDANAVANAVAAKIGDAAKSGVDSSLKGGPY
ncbi:TP901 family phage tail tape measure protein [Rhizobium rosettiformans]|uniref:Phage tail tape measure protein n=2 Tax=Rhizobium rosettiformans TaxID=1368430 RepID=A0A4S8Q6P2_9HYPH|nr:phage tail tape measure protein [Rhizobium rosettiformans]MBB5273978.1 TP901 family phage tail tape measure protein [Rhizobium rosettiformans]THV38352.1 phage tail tape measure protein [Rhizobium rosettiformans W3]